MEEFDDQERVSVTIDDAEILISDAESEEFDSSRVSKFGFFERSGMVRIEEGCTEHDLVKNSFLSGMGSFKTDTEVVAIHKNLSSSLIKQARSESFRIFSEAMAAKCGGDPNIKYAWYGGSRDEICEIVSRGFSWFKQPSSCRPSYGGGLHLFPAKSSIDSALSSGIDESGLMHVLLCRVILGNMEVISPGSKQSHPCSSKFDSGVDDLHSPTRYIVWSAFMNSHILPAYIISFKALYLDGTRRTQTNGVRPSSPWISFPSLMSTLAKFLHPSKMSLVAKCHDDFLKKKITRQQLIHRSRVIVGDKLLISVIKQYKNKP